MQMTNVGLTRSLANVISVVAFEVTAASHTAPAISSALCFCCVFDTDTDMECRLAYTEVNTYT